MFFSKKLSYLNSFRLIPVILVLIIGSYAILNYLPGTIQMNRYSVDLVRFLSQNTPGDTNALCNRLFPAGNDIPLFSSKWVSLDQRMRLVQGVLRGRAQFCTSDADCLQQTASCVYDHLSGYKSIMSEAHNWVGISLSLRGLPEEALLEYEKGIELDPGNAIWPYLQLAEYAMIHGDIGKGEHWYLAANKQFPKNPDVMRGLGWVELTRSNFKAARYNFDPPLVLAIPFAVRVANLSTTVIPAGGPDLAV